MTEAIQYDLAEVACPSTGEPCPARMRIVDLHTSSPAASAHLEQEIEIDDPNHPRFDGVKRQMRLTEHMLQAKARGCDGPAEDICSVRESMDNSKLRSTSVSIGRRVLQRIREL